jgi:hypothetical protein
MSESFYHMFYSESYHTDPARLTRMVRGEAPVINDEDVSYAIPADPSGQPLTDEAAKQLVEMHKEWHSDTVYKGVVKLVAEPQVMVVSNPVYFTSNLDSLRLMSSHNHIVRRPFLDMGPYQPWGVLGETRDQTKDKEEEELDQVDK